MKESEWQPTGSWDNLKIRARILAQLREFFAERNILEVDTPLLSHGTVTDTHLHSLKAIYSDQKTPLYLQTSPEFGMKRLLAAGSGPIYQICKSFRDGEFGQYHNPEFTMLEWYRPGFDHWKLMDETNELLQVILKTKSAERLSYRDLFKKFDIDPLTTSAEELKQLAEKLNISGSGLDDLGLDDWLQLIMSDAIEPHLGQEQPTFIYDFPASQAYLAKIRDNVAERFEVYIKGMEIGNGFHELIDADEQHDRFKKELAMRKAQGKAAVPLDTRLIGALANGMPECAGIAVGIDRLVMLASGADSLREVISFSVDRA